MRAKKSAKPKKKTAIQTQREEAGEKDRFLMNSIKSIVDSMNTMAMAAKGMNDRDAEMHRRNADLYEMLDGFKPAMMDVLAKMTGEGADVIPLRPVQMPVLSYAGAGASDAASEDAGEAAISEGDPSAS